MSVREVNDKFIGLRVERSIDKVPHVKFFSYRIRVLKNGITTYRNATRAEKKEILAAAEAYDKKLKDCRKNQRPKKALIHSLVGPIQGSKEFPTERAKIPKVMNMWASSSISRKGESSTAVACEWPTVLGRKIGGSQRCDWQK